MFLVGGVSRNAMIASRVIKVSERLTWPPTRRKLRPPRAPKPHPPLPRKQPDEAHEEHRGDQRHQRPVEALPPAPRRVAENRWRGRPVMPAAELRLGAQRLGALRLGILRHGESSHGMSKQIVCDYASSNRYRGLDLSLHPGRRSRTRVAIHPTCLSTTTAGKRHGCPDQVRASMPL